MNCFVIVTLALAGLVQCDIGYQYRVPPTSYEVPFGSVDRKYYHVEKKYPTGNLVSVSTPGPFLQSTFSNDFSGSTTPTPLFSINSNSFGAQEVSSSPGFTEGNFILNQFSGSTTPAPLGVSINSNSFGAQEVSSHPGFTGGNFISVTTPATLLQTPIREHSSFLGVQTKTPETVNQFSVEQPKVLLGAPVKNTETESNVVIDERSNLDDSEAEVQKHLYFFSAPEEPEEIQARIITPPPPTKQNVKIIFIKTPIFKTAPIHVPAIQQNEEKTKVYVLVKKPEEPTIVLPTPETRIPAKPEVIFIKYKSQKEAEEVVGNFQETGDSVSVSKNTIPGDQKVETHFSGNFDQNVNLVSTATPVRQDFGITASPVVISSTPSPVLNGFNGGIHGFSGFNNVPVSSFQSGFDQRGSSADDILNFGNVVSTESSLGSGSNQVSGEIKVHQVYGPPQARRRRQFIRF